MRTARYPEHITVRSRLRRTRRWSLPMIAATTVTALSATLLPPTALAAEKEYPPPADVGKIPYAELASIMNDANHALRYSMAVVAADPKREYEKGSVESVLLQGVRSLSDEYRKTLVTSARKMLDDEQARYENFGQFAEIDPEKYASMGFDKAFSPEFVKFDAEQLTARLRERAKQLEDEHEKEKSRAIAIAEKLQIEIPLPTVSSLELRVDQVRCVDETSDLWEWTNQDRIDIGGTTVDHRGNTRDVGPHMVGHFDDGVVKSYRDPGMLFARHDLSGADEWPRTYYAVVMLAEIDDGGGFANAIRGVWSKVRDKVTEMISRYIGDLLEEYVGAAFAEAIGQAIAWLVAGIFEWLVGLFTDDVFTPKTVKVELPSPYEFMYEDPSHHGWTDYRLPRETITYTGFSGEYKVNLHWQLTP